MLIEHIQLFLTRVKSDVLSYKFSCLSMVKNIQPYSKNFEHNQFFFEHNQFFLNKLMN